MRPIPSLSTNGWITSVPEICDYVFACFRINFESQDDFLTVTSLPAILQKNGSDIKNVERETEEGLRRMFMAFVDACAIKASVREKTAVEKSNSGNTALWTLEVKGTITVNGHDYNIGQQIEYAHNRITAVKAIQVN